MGKFLKPPIRSKEKEKKAEEFLDLSENTGSDNLRTKVNQSRVSNVEKCQNFLLRMPASLYDDVKEIHFITGMSMNAICLDVLRSNIKRKLREMKEE